MAIAMGMAMVMAMPNSRYISTSRLQCILLCTIVRAVISSGLGPCPLYPSLPHFDIRRMRGVWYEVESSFYLMELSASCTELRVDLNPRGQLTIDIHTRNRWSGLPSTTSGVGIPSHLGSPIFRYKQNSRLPYSLARLLPGAGQYQVLFTDYERFAILWSCSSLTVAHEDRIWILGRFRSLEAVVRAQIYGLLTELGLDPDRLMLTKQTNCPPAADSSTGNTTATTHTTHNRTDYN